MILAKTAIIKQLVFTKTRKFDKNDVFQGIFQAQFEIDGFKSKSRFGQALAALGDINQDGFGGNTIEI